MIVVEYSSAHTVEELIDLLESEPLTPRLERFEVESCVGRCRFRGHFAGVPRPFSVVTDDAEWSRRLRLAIKRNLRSEAYRTEALKYRREETSRAVN